MSKTDCLPPEGRDGDVRVSVSIGWCGGHGEVVLDEGQSIRRHDGLPIFVDPKSWELISGRIDLSGSFEGAPVVRVSGRGRLKKRRRRNSSIPGAPKQRYVALILASLSEARIDEAPA